MIAAFEPIARCRHLPDDAAQEAASGGAVQSGNVAEKLMP
jgi:hypothetical protein